MSSPLTIYVAAFSGLQMEIVDGNQFLGGSSQLGFVGSDIHTYRLKDPRGQFHIKNGSSLPNVISGKLSPTNKVTVPPATRKILGIHDDATHFAYAHPPKDFAENIDWSKYNFTADIDEGTDEFQDTPVECINQSERNWSPSQIDAGIIKRGMFPVLGGFVYFDKTGAVLSVNVLTFVKTSKQIFLTGPYNTPSTVVDAMAASDRIGIIPFEQFHESSFIAMGWVRPMEKLADEPLIASRGHNHGAFIMVRHDNTAVTYTVEKGHYSDYDGEAGILPDVYDSFYDSPGRFNPEPITSNFVDSSEINKWRTYINAKVFQMTAPQDSGRPSMNLSCPSGLEGETSLIHEAARSGVSLKNIKILLEDRSERASLGEQDACGWNPLHYACAFNPNNVELIELFIELCPESVTQRDSFGRYPLHLACNARAPVSVIKLLLEGKGRDVVTKPTVYLKRLPLHIAVNRNPDVEVISMLLEADGSGRSIREETSTGCRALHIAIAKRGSEDLIRMLLDADSSIGEGEIDDDADIMKYYRGRLPLHMACLNGSSTAIISMLLEKDVKSFSINAPSDEYANGAVAMQRNRLLRRSIRSSITYGGPSGKVALDIAIACHREDIVRLLLNKEGGNNVMASFNRPDDKGRYPLHKACNANLSPDIIGKMLHLDTTGEAVCHYDEMGLKPIQYACDHADAQVDVIEMLLEAEDMVSSSSRRSKSEVKYTNFGDKTALWFASRANAPVGVLDALMSRDDFTFKGFERKSTKLALALMIQKHPILQERLNTRMAKRINFAYLSLRLYVFLILITVFYYATEKLADGNVPLWCQFVIFCGTGVLTFAETVQVMNQSVRTYLLDPWNWYEITNIIFLWFSSWVLASSCLQQDEGQCPTHSFILVVTSLLLILNILFFLETTFYPFALFTTGLVTIVKVLLPFLTVTALVLIGFVATYRVRTNFNPDYEGHESCNETFQGCLLFVLNSFFGGPEETMGLLDVFFGIMVVVILLNVVIAIVSDAWEDAKALTGTSFWQSRVNFLAESGFDYQSKMNFSFLDWLDSLHFVPVNEQIPWHKDEPYKSVKCKEHHDNPRHYFLLKDAVKIEEARSLESTLFWVRAKSIANEENVVVTNAKLVGPTIAWFMGNLTYGVFIILGFPTLGILWPSDWRTYILSVATDTEGEQEEE